MSQITTWDEFPTVEYVKGVYRQTVSGDLYALTATEVVRTPTPTAVPTVSPYGPLEPRLCPTLAKPLRKCRRYSGEGT